jgi:hypothetical protein
MLTNLALDRGALADIPCKAISSLGPRMSEPRSPGPVVAGHDGPLRGHAGWCSFTARWLAALEFVPFRHGSAQVPGSDQLQH